MTKTHYNKRQPCVTKTRKSRKLNRQTGGVILLDTDNPTREDFLFLLQNFGKEETTRKVTPIQVSTDITELEKLYNKVKNVDEQLKIKQVLAKSLYEKGLHATKVDRINLKEDVQDNLARLDAYKIFVDNLCFPTKISKSKLVASNADTSQNVKKDSDSLERTSSEEALDRRLADAESKKKMNIELQKPKARNYRHGAKSASKKKPSIFNL